MDKKTINVPENWGEVSLGQYQEVMTLDRTLPDYDVEFISIMTDEDPELIRRLDVPTYSKILSSLAWTAKPVKEFNYKPIIKIEDQEYGLIKMSSLTNGQWMSIENWLEKYNENLHKICALIYRPLIVAVNDDKRIVEDYDTEDAPERAKLFQEKLTYQDFSGAIGFFLLTEKKSLGTIREYLETQVVVKAMMIPGFLKKRLLSRERKRQREGSGRGIPFFTNLLKATLRKYQKSQNSTSFSPSLTGHLK